MAKISENMIPDINADWGLDARNNLPYSGEAVQEFIKRTLKQKHGYFHYDEDQNKYLVFADQASMEGYYDGDDSLLLSIFDAPASYTIECDLESGAYNSVLFGSTGNLLRFKAVTKKSNADVPEGYICNIKFTNGGVQKTLPLQFNAEESLNGITINIDKYLLEGTNAISINLKGISTSTVTTITAFYNAVRLSLEDSFDISNVYETTDNLIVPLVVSGSGIKTMEWWIDGEQLEYNSNTDFISSPESNVTKVVSLSEYEPGLHSLQFRVYTESNGQKFYSNTLFRNFFIKGDTPLIGVATELPIGIVEPGVKLTTLYGLIQYFQYNLRYAIYDPDNKVSSEIKVYIDNSLYQTINAVNGLEDLLSIIVNNDGDATIKLEIDGTSYEISTDVEKSSINIYEIPTDVLNLRAFGRNNNPSPDRDKWTYGDITSTFTGFYWNSQSGWVNNSLIINNGAKLEIDYAPLSIDWTNTQGATFEFEFSTKNVQDENSPILDLRAEDGQGIVITASEAKMITSGNQIVSTKFKSGVNNRIVFVINPKENANNERLLFIYVNGIICGAINYEKGNTVQSDKKLIFGGNADIILKHIRFYDNVLTSNQILNNYILYRDELTERLDIYTRNDILNAKNEIDPEKIKKYLPVMYFTCLGDENSNIPWLESQNKSEAKDYKIFCDIEYVDLADETRNFKIKNSRVRLQGTSSIQYPKKNWRFYTAKDKDTVYIDYQGNEYYAPENKDDYGTDKDLRKYAIRENSIPVDCWCLKTDYAESSSSHNTGTAKLWNKVLTDAQVTYNNVNKSEHYMLYGINEYGETPIYTFWDKDKLKLDQDKINQSNFTSFYYKLCTRQEIINTGLISYATTVNSIPTDLTVNSDLFVIIAYQYAALNDYVLRTEAQKAAIKNNYLKDVRTAIDGFPIVVFYRLNENSDWIFLGKHNFNNDKSTEAVFGFKDIPGFDNSRMQCWELTNNNNELGFFTTVEGWYEGDKKLGWQDAFEARYPDDGDEANTSDLYDFAEWISNLYQKHLNGEPTNFETEKWEHFDVYKMASYYIYLMRFGAVDQVVKNSMFTSEDGDHFYFIIYDNDTILGVRNDGRLVFDPTIDRQSKDPQSPKAYAYAGHNSAIWNLLENDQEFMDIVKAVDNALYNAGLRYDNVIKAYESEQTSKWCEWIYNNDAELKYIGPFNKGFGTDDDGNKVTSYKAGLLSLQGNRNSHRQWWLAHRFNLYDAKFITGTFKDNNIFLKMQDAPKGLEFTITSAANVAHGYEITNGPSEISELVDINNDVTFTIPQSVSIGDPIVIFGATNIKKLNLSQFVPYMTEIQFAKAYSETLGSTIEELIMFGENNEGVMAVSGLEGMTALKKLDVTGVKGIRSLSLYNSYNLKELLAEGTSISTVDLAPGCLIENLKLPDTIENLILKELPLLKPENLFLTNWNKVREIEIKDCPNLVTDFNLIWDWYQTTSNVSNRRLVMTGLNWTNVSIDNLIDLIENVDVDFSGESKIGLKKIEEKDKRKLLVLRNKFGNSVFNKDSDLYIYCPNSIYLFGPENGILTEGSNYQFETIVFGDGKSPKFFLLDKREGVDLDEQTGYLTTEETGENDSIITVEVRRDQSSSETITIKKKIYPEKILINGPSEITGNAEYTWQCLTPNVTGKYDIKWELLGDITQYITGSWNGESYLVTMSDNVPETVARGHLRLTLEMENNTKISYTFDLVVRNPEVILMRESNPEIMTILSDKIERFKNRDYLTKEEVKSIIISDLMDDKLDPIFKNSNIVHFEEFKYFTGITKIPSFCFSECIKLKTIELPETIETIELRAFQNCKSLIEITIPDKTLIKDQSVFWGCENLVSINTSTYSHYRSEGGCLYEAGKLYIVASGLETFELWSEATAIISTQAFISAPKLTKIVLNDKINSLSGQTFLYGIPNLTEIIIPEDNPYYKIYDNCIYNNIYDTLIYCPSGLKTVTFHDNVKTIGRNAFGNNHKISKVEIPNTVEQIEASAFYACQLLKEILIPESVKRIGTNCFQSCEYLGDITCVNIIAPVTDTNTFGDQYYYAGSKANVKILHFPSGASGYDKDGWKTLTETIGFDIDGTL